MRKMQRVRRVVLAGVAAMAAAGCGASEDPESVAPTTTVADGDLDTQQQVADGFAALTEGGAYVATVSTGLVNRVPALGIDSVLELDESRPFVTIEVASNGDSYRVIDLGPTLAASAGGSPEIGAQFDDVEVVTWLVGDQLVIDTTSYEVLQELNLGVDLGVFAPGVWEVDLGALGSRDADDVIAVLVGPTLDPVDLAEALPGQLSDVAPDPDDPSRYVGTVPYAEFLTAQGTDAEAQAAAVVASLSQLVGGETEQVTDALVGFYETLETDIEFVIADGIVTSMSWRADLSGLYNAMVEASAAGQSVSPQELEEARSFFDDAVQIAEGLATFELVDEVDVTLPAGDLEDRTDQVVDFLDDAGVG